MRTIPELGSPPKLFSLRYPRLDPEVLTSPEGIRYLREPGVVLIAQPAVDITGMQTFLEGFDPELGFPGYVDDPLDGLPNGTHLCKTAGQTCYCSWGPGKRTMNVKAKEYIRNILESGHGSVLEHANYSFFLYGISRSITHELVRHRAGCAYSQVSQRYVDDTTLRFIMRPETVGDEPGEQAFFRWIKLSADEYEAETERLVARQLTGTGVMTAETKRDARKKVRQAARAVLPNETEAPMTFTANARALRHTLEMRASEHAETEIRRLFMKIYRVVVSVEPIIFGDYEVVDLPDGTQALRTAFRKV